MWLILVPWPPVRYRWHLKVSFFPQWRANSAEHTSHLILLQLPKLANTLEVKLDLRDALVITLFISFSSSEGPGGKAYRLNLWITVERDFIFIVDVVELFLCDLDSGSRNEYHLIVSFAWNDMEILTLPSSSLSKNLSTCSLNPVARISPYSSACVCFD